MKRLYRVLACLAFALGAAAAEAEGRILSQPELDALLAPIALYPDPLLSHVLNAAVYPQDVAEAAAWSRANPRLQGDDAVRAVDHYVWHPSVKALVAYPDILARMAESPQWVADLGDAYLTQSAEVTATIQGLRARAQASGSLQSNDQQYVYDQGGAIYVQPVYPQYVWVPYYDPFIVYGAWWWPAFQPFCFRPWHPRVVTVTHVHVRKAPPIHWHRPAAVHVKQPAAPHTGQWAAQPPRPHAPSPANVRPQPAANHPWAAPQRPPRAQFQPARAQAQMPAAHIRATPAPVRQQSVRGHASGGGGWANPGRGHARGGGGRRG